MGTYNVWVPIMCGYLQLISLSKWVHCARYVIKYCLPNHDKLFFMKKKLADTRWLNWVAVSNVAGVGLGNKACFDSIMNAAAMKLLCLVVLMGCCGQGQKFSPGLPLPVSFSQPHYTLVCNV